MKKIIVIFGVLLLVLSGCSNDKQEDLPNEIIEISDLKILTPSGAPSLALLDIMSDNITVVDGVDPLQAAFVNPNPEYDFIIAPTNLGTKLASLNNTEYRLLAVVTWGNLYLVADENADLNAKDQKLAAFGEVAVPGLVFNSVMDELDIQNEITYYASVTEAQAALLTGAANSALLAEPAATATIAKAKQNDIKLSIIADVQALWDEKYGSEGYPQASIFVLNSFFEENPESVDNLINAITESVNFYNDEANSDVLISKLEEVGVENLGLPSAEIVSKTFVGMNLDVVLASNADQALKDFLALFSIEYSSELSVFK